MRLIDADAFDEVLDEYEALKARAAFTKGIMVARRELADSPAIEAEPVRHGRWLSPDCFLTCSLCEAVFDRYDDGGNFQDFAYCPNCGAKMDGGAEG